MPWLIKDQQLPLSECLFFVHVPRCGGTSLMYHFDLPSKVQTGRSLWGRLGMAVFFSRYKTLEKANFPVVTWGNAFAAACLMPGIYLVSSNTAGTLLGIGLILVVSSVVLFLLLTVVFTAPVIGRFACIHRAYLVFVHYVLCRFMESIPWCTGTNKTGYIMHLTAHKLISYQYVTAEEMEKVCSMAIVRNPYSRMVSIYSFNRFGEWESFGHFIDDWYKNVTKAYRERGEMEEWYTPSHAIPQFEYTHFEGKQLVRSIVKQEDLKYLKATVDTESNDSAAVPYPNNSTVANLPTLVRNALLGMPHTNQRKLAKKWYDYYDQRTLDLVYEIYEKDFEVFGYGPVLTQRPDLKPPTLYVAKHLQVAAECGSDDDDDDVGKMDQIRKACTTAMLEKHPQAAVAAAALDIEEGAGTSGSTTPTPSLSN
jgi:Sulfotransferase family